MVAGLLTAALARRLCLQKTDATGAPFPETAFGDGPAPVPWEACSHADGFRGDIIEIGTLRGVPVVPVLKDFDPEVDSLDILYKPSECPHAEMTAHQGDGSLTVEVNGTAVAHLAGLTRQDLSAIRLVALR